MHADEIPPSSPSPIDPHFMQAVVEALRQHELAQGLPPARLQAIACAAINGAHLQDSLWLEQRLTESQQELDWDSPRATGITADSEDLAEPGQEGLKASPAGKAVSALPPIEVSAPAKINCQADLDQVISQHREWMEAVLNPQKDQAAGRANLRGADLSGLNLEGVNLSCADFTAANLQGAQLAYANLSRCKFIQTNLQEANLRGAKLKKAQMEGANLSQANLEEVDLREVDLSKAILEQTKLPKEAF